MGYQQTSVQAYRQTSVKTAGGGRLIVMLYDEAIRQLDRATELLDTGSRQLDLVNNAVVKAQDIVTELLVSLDLEQGGDIAHNLFRLYLYFNEQLMEGNVRKDAAVLRAVRQFLAELREAWKEIESTAVGARPVATPGVNIAG